MPTLYDKIKRLHPELTDKDFNLNGTIRLQNDSDGKGDYIAHWDHPTIARPTDEQLAAAVAPQQAQQPQQSNNHGG